MNLPSGRPKKWTSFLDYLKFYNLQDCKPLSEALLNSFDLFKKTFDVEMNREYSLAAFSQSALMKLYNTNVPNIFSFPKNTKNVDFDKITSIFRKNTYGGICGLYHRHISLMDEPAPDAAKYNKKGL